jgi:tRNA-(ms[2]io[6]A)-hydroxylase
MVKQDLPGLTQPLEQTSNSWVETVFKDFDEFLKDHASCEKKASGMAMSMASHYPDRPRLLTSMIDLAVEELSHYREVVRILTARNQQPGPDQKDAYVIQLNGLARKGKESFLLDRLLIAALVERRGAERFQLIANQLSDPELKIFYTSIAKSESRHWQQFVELSKEYFTLEEVEDRLNTLSIEENRVMKDQPLRPALH